MSLIACFQAQQRHLVSMGFSRASEARFAWNEEAHDTDRHYARTGGLQVEVAPSITRLPPEQQVAILRHEWGHVLDNLYGPRIKMAGGRVWVGRASGEAWEAWGRRNKEARETWADGVAHAVFPGWYGYDGPLQLQTLGAGTVPRPRGLK